VKVSEDPPRGHTAFLGLRRRIQHRAIPHPRMPHSPYASPTTQTNAGLLPRNTPSKSHAESQAAWLTSSASLSTISRTFNSLSKVLFIFPSRYLFAIGLAPIISFRWRLPPTLSSNPKLLDSWNVYHKARYFHGHRPAVSSNQHLSWNLISVSIWRFNLTFGSSHSASSAYQKWPTRHYLYYF